VDEEAEREHTECDRDREEPAVYSGRDAARGRIRAEKD
jgi:hypothetical protein